MTVVDYLRNLGDAGGVAGLYFLGAAVVGMLLGYARRRRARVGAVLADAH